MPDGIVVLGTREWTQPFRLAGLGTRVPPPGRALEALRAAAADGAQLVLLTPACAEEIEPAVLASLRRQGRPLILVLPGQDAARFDIAPQIRRCLGLES